MRALLKSAVWRAQSLWRGLRGRGPGHCTICGRDVPAFLPFRSGESTLSPVLRELEVVGSDLERFRCPRCASTDRERHLVAYMERAGLLDVAGKRVLHFAPEPHLRTRIRAAKPSEYIQGDLFPAEPQIVKVDITRMAFGDAYFDLLIANHVLEHVPDDAAALREIVRVLKPGGHAILQTPHAARIERSIEIAALESPASRLLLYGQEDHVRLYGTELFARICASGLESQVRSHDEALPDLDAQRHGMNPREPFMCYVRR